MTHRRVSHPDNLIYSPGTQVVVQADVRGSAGRILHPQGAVGVIVAAAADLTHAYRVRFLDGVEASLKPDEIMLLARYKEGVIGDPAVSTSRCDLFGRVFLRCVIGSRAYGLDTEASDTDLRGVYLPPAELQWSLYGVPEQLERDETQEVYWELQKFLILALKANPNVLECLYSPLVEFTTPLGEELLSMRSAFLSRLVYQTYNGYVTSQFKKMQADLRNQGHVKWKHVMHLLRLLLAGIHVLEKEEVPVRVQEHRDSLLAIRRGATPWQEVESWRQELHRRFDAAFEKTALPLRPNYEQANAFLVKARKLAIADALP